MLELSKAVQRIVEVERKVCEALREELAAAKAALAAKEDALPGAGKVSSSDFVSCMHSGWPRSPQRCRRVDGCHCPIGQGSQCGVMVRAAIQVCHKSIGP